MELQYNVDADGLTVNWYNIKVLIMTKEMPYGFCYKSSYKEDCFK